MARLRLAENQTMPPATHREAPHLRGLVYRRRVAGAMLTVVGLTASIGLLAFPHERTDAGLVACALATLVIGVPLLVRPAAAPEWTSQLLIALVTGVITAAVAFGGVAHSVVSDLTVMYVLVAIYSCYFFSARLAFAQVALASAAEAVLMISGESRFGVGFARWALTTAAMVVAGLMVRAMNREVDGLVAELDAAALHDPLTGVLNRRGFNERLELEITRARRSGEPLTLLAVDLDGLKAVNDNQGHAAGDATLHATATALGRDLRDIDALGRVGGDEFLVLLPACDMASGYRVAEKLRSDLARETSEEPWAVSISIGVATSPPCELDAAMLNANADTALYAAKDLGRDRVVGAESASCATHA